MSDATPGPWRVVVATNGVRSIYRYDPDTDRNYAHPVCVMRGDPKPALTSEADAERIASIPALEERLASTERALAEAEARAERLEAYIRRENLKAIDANLDTAEVLIGASGDLEALEAQRDAALEALRYVLRVWTFGDGQEHTHSWHTRENWRERHAEVLAALLADAGPQPEPDRSAGAPPPHTPREEP